VNLLTFRPEQAAQNSTGADSCRRRRRVCAAMDSTVESVPGIRLGVGGCEVVGTGLCAGWGVLTAPCGVGCW
ncbi:hypothetical protein, partial [Mycobacteroides abscessus]|uniref:hypothetical protein n=1 Tax=Mycobacteroides abscessus TaxID=36809 RepID=UPI001A7E14DA